MLAALMSSSRGVGFLFGSEANRFFNGIGGGSECCFFWVLQGIFSLVSLDTDIREPDRFLRFRILLGIDGIGGSDTGAVGTVAGCSTVVGTDGFSMFSSELPVETATIASTDVEGGTCSSFGIAFDSLAAVVIVVVIAIGGVFGRD